LTFGLPRGIIHTKSNIEHPDEHRERMFDTEYLTINLEDPDPSEVNSEALIITINRPKSQNPLPVQTNVGWASPHAASLSNAKPCQTLSPPAPLHPPGTLHKSKLFMQNKPNLKNTKTNLALCPKKVYEDFPLPGNLKNKPKTNPIKPNPTAQIKNTNPIQTQFPARPKPPLSPIAHNPNQTQSSQEPTDNPQATPCRPSQLPAPETKPLRRDYRITLINMQTIEYGAPNGSGRSFICLSVPSWRKESELVLNRLIYRNGVSEDG